VRLSRTKRTAKPKHYAFLEFQHADVARIAADAMDGYFMFKQVGAGCGVGVVKWGGGGDGRSGVATTRTPPAARHTHSC
jgi:hypothetical protein